MKRLESPDVGHLLQRIDRLGPESVRRWGTMTLPKMVRHIADQMRAALGELECANTSSLFTRTVVRWVALWGPWPKGAPSSPDMLKGVPAGFEDDIAEVKELLQRAAATPSADPWPAHPAFGRMSGALWKHLIHRHLDHHLRQFSA